ncbi:MAG: hypothetical protein HY670_02065 [Chloroflexi bacterium]|nr:hypothetical protein [Chloroflexota bacterium]
MKTKRLGFLFVLILAIVSLVLSGCTRTTPVPTPTPTVTTTPTPIPAPPPQPTPRFEIAALTIMPARVVVGQPVTIEASVANMGNAAGSYTVVFKINDATVETKDVALGAGEQKTVAFQYTARAAGKQKVELNTLAGTVEVLRPAEFRVTSIGVSPAEIIAGKDITINVEIENTGEVEGTYPAKVTVDGKVVASKDVTVGANARNTFSFPHILDKSGARVIDVGGVTKTVTALKAAELKASLVKVTPALVFPGQTATVEAEVTNAGEVKGNLTASLRVNNVEVDTRPLSLDAGATSKPSFTVVRDQPGSYEIKVGEATASLTVAEVETSTSEAFNYTMLYPKGWVLNEDNPQQVTMVKQGVGLLMVVAEIVPVAVSSEEYFRLFSSSLASSVSDLKTISQNEVRENGAIVGFRLELSFTATNGAKTRGSYLITKRGRFAFIAFGQVAESVWDLNAAVIDAALNSFKPPVVAVGSYANDVHGFALTLPTGWDARETGDRVRVVEVLNTAGLPLIRTSVFVERVDETATAQPYALEFAGSFQGQTGYKLVSQGQATLAGTAAYEVILTITAGTTPLTMRIVSAKRGTQMFTIHLVTATTTYDSQRNTIDQLVRSFALTEPKPFGVSRQDSLFLWQGDIVTLDPALSEDAPDGIIGAIFSGLVRIDKDLKVAPDIAERWDISADGKTYTFYLRAGVKFHNGKAVTAHDLKYSWERALDPQTKSRKARTYMGDIVGAADMLAGKATELSGVKVIDDRTLQVTIDGPKPYFLGKLAYVTAFVVDRANVARGKGWTDAPNGTGPFELKQWLKDELLVLERNDNFYLGPAKLQNIVFQIFAGRPMLMYENGELDVTGVGLNDIERVLDPADPLNKELLTVQRFQNGFLGFNVTKPPFDDPKVRRAFALAVDWNKIIEVSLKGVVERAAGYVPPGVPGHNAELKPLPFDPTQAKQLIAESKYGSVDKLPPVTLYVLFGAGPSDEAMVAMWQQNLGVAVNVEAVRELAEWQQRSHDREFQLFTSGWVADYLDPQNFLEVLFHSQSEENHLAYANPAVDAALAEAAVTRDNAARLKKYQEIEKTILQDLPAAPFDQSGKSYTLVKPYVKGFNLYPISVNQWWEISIVPH